MPDRVVPIRLMGPPCPTLSRYLVVTEWSAFVTQGVEIAAGRVRVPQNLSHILAGKVATQKAAFYFGVGIAA